MSTAILPIDEVLGDVLHSLNNHRNIVVQAQPGAGKTTRVPLSLLSSEWLNQGKVVMLEPRRLAARNAALFMSQQTRTSLGDLVGYRIRGETRVSSATRIEVVTEGILTRILQDDPELKGIGCIVFDEFHERGINSDVGLALCLEAQKAFRPDLRIVVMSATLDGEAVAKILGDAPLITCPGRKFPVEITYIPEINPKLEERILAAVRRALREGEGDILVFLPGKGEILRSFDLISRSLSEEDIRIHQLFSELRDDEQRAALQPSIEGKRKIILATSIAETSITIQGVRAVIDSGLMRVARFDPRRAMAHLETITVTQASADQRAGRAGRLGPGRCYRLWSEADHRTLLRFNSPEILNADLVPFALELALWGEKDASKLSFLDPPSEASVAQARGILRMLGAVSESGQITEHGRAMGALSVHPRLAHMLLAARRIGRGRLGCDLAALLEEQGGGTNRESDIDLYQRWLALETFRSRGGDTRSGFLSRITKQADRLAKTLQVTHEPKSPCDTLGILVALAYPDRLAVQREPGGRRYLMQNGSGAELPPHSLLSKSRFLAIADLEGSSAHAKVYLAEPVEESEIRRHFGHLIKSAAELFWDEKSERVTAKQTEKLGLLTLSERPIAVSDEESTHAMIEGIRRMGISSLPWSTEARALQERVLWVRRSGLRKDEWADLSDEALLSALSDWLAPYLGGITSRAQLAKLDLVSILKGALGYERVSELDSFAPSHIELPTGTQARIDYGRGEVPAISVMLQEMFGQRDTPSVAGGKVRLTVELLSPAKRPLQITRDLSSFWSNSYREVRKEMIGRYPKHVWPEDPVNAAPTKRAKRRPQ